MRRIKLISPPTVIAAVLAVCILAMPRQVLADTRVVSLTASPAILETTGEAGGKASISFQVKNNSETTLPIHMSTRDSRQRDGQPEGLMRSLSAKEWVKFTEPDFILQANETKTIEATVLIPENTPSGGHYVDLVVQPLSLENDDGVIATQPELAVQVMAAVSGDTKENLRISLDGPSTIIASPSRSNTVSYSITNDGNIHTLYSPSLYISRGGDQQTVSSHPEIILPGEVKKVTFTVPHPLSAGVYSSQIKFNYGTNPKEAIGPEIRIIALPFDPRLLLIFPAIVVAAYGYYIRHRVVKAVKIITRGE